MEGLKEWAAWPSVGSEERKRHVDEAAHVSRGRIDLRLVKPRTENAAEPTLTPTYRTER